jgi:hypothetical protein
MFHQPYQGGSSYPNPQEGILNLNPSRLLYGQPFPGVLNPTWGPQGKQCYPPQGPTFYPPQGKIVYPPQGKTVYPPLSNQTNYPPTGYTIYPP